MKRQEYPNPQFERKDWINLNGEWEFEIDNEKAGFNRELLFNPLNGKIEVPFCPESKLSGIAHTDFIYACWYRKRFALNEKQLSQRITLNFGAVDYSAKVYVNGKYAGEHRGGYTPFGFDISAYVQAGENEIVAYVEDDINANAPSGKQSPRKKSFGCFYTRTTGVWQTVYLEFTPKSYIKSVKYYPDIMDCSVDIEAVIEGNGTLTANVFYKGKSVGTASVELNHKKRFTVKLNEKHLWEIEKGKLYDVELIFGKDKVYSYFGLREVGYDGLKFLVNGKPVFQRFVLDQGYNPYGVYTAGDAGDFARDIKLATDLGFNGARLHQKVFEPGYLYECDKAGFMVWGEMASWGIKYYNLDALGVFVNEWQEVLERDFNHPCIVTWCPLNEACEDLQRPELIRDKRFCEALYDFTKTMDPTRPCVDTSGGYHGGRTDVYDVHCYREISDLQACLDALVKGEMVFWKAFAPEECDEAVKYLGQPVSVSEYGGKAFSGGTVAGGTPCAAGETICVDKTEAWGYCVLNGEKEFVEDFMKLTEALLNCSKLSGFCYTQLYDVEQEQNGLYTFDRKPKLSPASVEKIKNCIQGIFNKTKTILRS